MNSRKLTFILTFTLTLCALSVLVNLVSASYLITSYSGTNNDNPVYMRNNAYTGSAGTQAIGETFVGNGGYLSQVNFWLYKSGTPSGSVRAGLFYAGNKSLIEYSGFYDIPSLPESAAWVPFYFNGSSLLVSDQEYFVAVICWSISPEGSANVVYVGTDASAPSYSGSYYRYESAAWQLDNSVDACFEVYAVGSAPTPTATPVPLPTGGAYDTSNITAVINALFGYLVPLLLWLIPAGLLGWLSHWSKWPIMIGLAIGGGLCYLFLGTQYVWMVFIVTIGLIGMAYQSVRGGGAEQ